MFETIDRSLSEINEIIRGIPDADIKSREEALHVRLKQLADSLPQMKSAWIFDAQGRALVNSLVLPAPESIFPIATISRLMSPRISGSSSAMR